MKKELAKERKTRVKEKPSSNALEAFKNFYNVANPKRISRNLRSMFLDYSKNFEYANTDDTADLQHDFYQLFLLLDTCEDELLTIPERP